MYGERRSFAPVKVGDELDVKIEAVGAKGDGIAKKDGFVLFIANTKEGDEVKVRITRVLRKVGFAEVVGEGSAPSAEAGSEKSEAAPEESEESKESEESDEESSEESKDSEDFGEEDKQE